MKITDFKVGVEEYAGRDVSSLPDRPVISSSELKARFDSPAKVVLGGKYNKLIDALASIKDGESGAHYIGSAPVQGVSNPDGALAVNVGDQIAALQRNIAIVAADVADVVQDVADVSANVADVTADVAGVTRDVAGVTRDVADVARDVAGVAQNVADIAANSGGGSCECTGGTAADGQQATVELPVAAGENLKTPCVVKLGSDGVRAPRFSALRGTQEFLQFILESDTNSLYGASMLPLFGKFAVIAYNKRVDSAYSPCVSIAKIENGFVTELKRIHTGPYTSSTTKMSMRLRKNGENKWLVCFCEPSSSVNYIYAFSFDGEAYSELAKYTGVSSILFAENKFCFLSDDTVFFKYYASSNTHGVAVKFTGTAFTAGTPVVLYAGASDFPTVRLADDLCVFKTSNTVFRVASIKGSEITLGNTFTYPKTISGFAAVSRSRFGLFSVDLTNIEFAFMNIGDSGEITAETAQRVAGTTGSTPSVTALSDEFVQVLHYLENAGANMFRACSVFSVKEDGIKLISSSVWPRYSTLAEEAAYPDVVPVYNQPYVFAGVSNASKTALVNGMALCGTYLEPVSTAGIAVSAANGAAKVLIAPGIVKGFRNLKRGTVYSIGFGGQLLDAGEHPLAVKVGTAVDEETLWFSGV